MVAYNKGDERNFHRLQKKLMDSFAARALAVAKVTPNKGGKTPGVDNIIWDSPCQKYLAIIELQRLLMLGNKYEAGDIKRVLIDKPHSK